MTIDDFKKDLSQRLGVRVVSIFTRDGDPAADVMDVYQAAPAGFGGKLMVSDGKVYMWELWLEDETNWNFQAKQIPRV
ncbi:hypothetical protein [Synechococcus sp. MIT S1220]|uniref:hypothetical protein n=1 Tax=Synechococcus sp. MIT S1220 TaxID=3082549 RepID=UPI0039AECFFE